MSGVLARTLGVLELLSQHPEGLELGVIAQTLNMPRSGAHRLLVELVEAGYVRQLREQGDYRLTTKLVSLGLSFLSHSGIVDVAQPLLDRLAEISGELVRLSIVDGERLTWVARAQGARQGLRYDPDMGSDAKLSCSSSGLAWMACLQDEEAVRMVLQQGLGKREDFGPNAPESVASLMQSLEAARSLGYALTEETYAPGLNGISVAVRFKEQAPLGMLTLAGPSVRFTRARMEALAPELMSHAQQLAAASGASAFFRSHRGLRETSPSSVKPIYAA